MSTRSVYQAPAVDPAEMTEEEKAQFSTAQVAMVAAAAGVQSKGISDSITLALVPLLQGMNFYDPPAIVRFAAKAAERVEAGRQQQAIITWAAFGARMAAYDLSFPANTPKLERASRATDLEVAYERPAAAYRTRMAAGTESIKKMIAEVEEQRFIELGGTTEEEISAQEQAQAGSEGKKPGQDGKAGEGKKASGAKAKEAGSDSRRKPVKQLPPDDPEPNRDDADFDFDTPEEAQVADNARIREQAKLSEEEKTELLQERALEEAEERLERMVNDDIGMAKRDAHQMAMRRAPAQVIGYRRVIHPELAETGLTCGLCVAASTQIYKRGELMPIHNLCNCEPVEVFKDADPGDQINKEDLLTLYEEAGEVDGPISTYSRDLKKQRYEVYDHPELGPVLRNPKHKKATDIKFSTRETGERFQQYRKKVQEKKAEQFGR